MSNDKKTLGVTKSNASHLSDLCKRGNFPSELDAAKFAMAYAITNKIATGTTDGAETKWNVGSVDPDGSIRSLIEALFPSSNEPYRQAEYLINEGLRLISEEFSDGKDVYEIIFSVK